MKQTLLLIVTLNVFGIAHSQGITLLYKGGGSRSWNDSLNWIQINTPVGQPPIQRVPTELDEVIINSSLSGLSTVIIVFDSSLNVGSDNSAGSRCRSMHVSNTEVSFQNPLSETFPTIDVYTTNGGFVLIDSGSNFRYGHFQLHGGNPAITDLEIVNSTFGSLFSHNAWSDIGLDMNGKARLLNSTVGGLGLGFGGGAGSSLYADNCKFVTSGFSVGDNSTDSIFNCQIVNDGTSVGMGFFIGRNSNFVSSHFDVTSYSTLNFTTSGSVLNGDVSTVYAGGQFSFNQEDPLHPLPNIINGNLDVKENNEFPISGDVKISGNFSNRSGPLDYYIDTANIVINHQNIFIIGGLPNYGKTDSIVGCAQNYCHFKMEFFGDSNSNILWPIGFPIDTLVINKTGCAKVTSTNSLYVSGQAEIKSGQLVLNPNDTIPYKFVCAGDLNIFQGGGVFLRRDSAGLVANMAVVGAINDYNAIADSLCTGLSNPYNGNITLYRDTQNGGSHSINITSASNIGNLNLIGQVPGSDFMLAGNLVVNNFNFINPAKLLLGDHNLAVNGNISNYGPNNYFITNGLGQLQINNIGNIATVFPVGISSSYNPATVTNFGTADNFSINVQPQVLSGGANGSPYIAGVVNRTWNIDKSKTGASNVTVTLQWNGEDELSGFTRNTSFVSHYTSGAWNNGIQMPANGAGPYSLTRTGITSLSPFAVMSPSGVVPITLLDFNGRYQDRAVALNWSTLTEMNTSHFTIEKSTDAILFRPLADIRAYGNSQFKRSYSYVDNAVLGFINYYRLKMLDISGKYFYSKTIRVSATGHLAVVSPNPVKDELFIRLQDGSSVTTLRIVDTKGTTVKILKLEAGVTATSINTTDLPAGVYSIIFDSGKIREALQFIKQ